MSDKERGLYPKFRIERTDGKSAEGEKHENCEYFVLDLTHDRYAIPALVEYARQCDRDGYRELAADLGAMLLRAGKAQGVPPRYTDHPAYPRND